MRTTRLLIAASMAMVCQLSHSNEAKSPGVILSSIICLEQSEENKLTAVGQQILAGEDYQKRLASLGESNLKCLIEKKLVAAQLCTAIVSNDPETSVEGPEKINAELEALSPRLDAALKDCSAAK
jgi:hypothetical protein